jgi:hypothetical protein
MKKFTLLLLISTLIFTGIMNAQIKKGAIFLGGDIGGSTQKTKTGEIVTGKQKGLSISPVFGKAIKENLILGVNAGLVLYENNTGISANAQKGASYKAGAFLRKYSPIGKSNFYLFLQGGLSINYDKNENVSPPSNLYKIQRYTVGITGYPGISYTVSKRLQLETGFNNLLNLNYFTEKKEYSSTTYFTEKTNGVSVNSSINNLSSLYIGFRILINK